MFVVPDPSPVTLILETEAQEYVTPVIPFDTSWSLRVIVIATSEHVVSVPAIATGSGFTVMT